MIYFEHYTFVSFQFLHKETRFILTIIIWYFKLPKKLVLLMYLILFYLGRACFYVIG
jgi:hypothetical protein